MDLTRAILDGLAMSAAFNLATGLLLVINPVIFTTSFPRELQKVAPKNPHATRHKLLFALFVLLPVTAYGIVSAHHAGVRGFWPLFQMGYLEWFLVNLGDFFGLDLYLREKMGPRMELPGTHGHPCYTRSGWMKSLGLPEHWLLWPFLICPFFAALSAAIGQLL